MVIFKESIRRLLGEGERLPILLPEPAQPPEKEAAGTGLYRELFPPAERSGGWNPEQMEAYSRREALRCNRNLDEEE